MPDCSQLALTVLKLLLAGLQTLIAEAVERLGVPGMCVLAAGVLLLFGVSARLVKLLTSPRGIACFAALLLAVAAWLSRESVPSATPSTAPIAAASFTAGEYYRFHCKECTHATVFQSQVTADKPVAVLCPVCGGLTGRAEAGLTWIPDKKAVTVLWEPSIAKYRGPTSPLPP
jgi:hypothetical protein